MAVLKSLLLAIVMDLNIHISWGKLSSPSKQIGFTVMVDKIDDTNKLWHQCLVHTNFGTLHHMSCLRMVDGFP